MFGLFKRDQGIQEQIDESPLSRDGVKWENILSVTRPIDGVKVHTEFGLSEDANFPEEFLDSMATDAGRDSVAGLVLGLVSAEFLGIVSSDPDTEVTHYHRVLVSRDSGTSSDSGFNLESESM